MSNPNRREVQETTNILNNYDTIHTTELIDQLKHLRSQGYSKIELESYMNYDSAFAKLNAIKTRKETEEEYKTRLEREKVFELRREAELRAQYEKLKAQFG